MGSLFGTLSLLTNALQVDQTGLQVTTNNVANANTPGYSREQVNLAAQPSYTSSLMSGGGGVTVESIQGIRDAVLAQRVNQETQQQGQLGGYLQQMSQLQAVLNDTGGAGLSGVLNDFFAKLQTLSANPSDVPTRQAVLSSAGNLVNAFNTMADGLAQQRTSVDQAVLQDVQEVNGLTAQIATLNQKIATATGLQQDTNALVDQRGQLLTQLSKLINVSTVSGNSGSITVTTANGAALVVGNQSQTLTTQVGSDGVNHIYSGATDITTTVSSGEIAGLIQARDTGIPNVQTQLNTLVTSFANAFNTQHAAGYDLNGNAGGAFFTIGSATEPAATISVAITDPTKIAASSDTTTGNNINALALAGLQQQAISGGQSVMDLYTGMVSSVGNEVATATSDQTAGQLVLTQLQNQQSSVSGVNLDEESINLSRFQQAYQAAAKAVTVIDSLTSLAINLGKD